MQNIEFKAELRNPDAARAQCVALGADHLGSLCQTDTYFKLADGRLKRREAPGEPVEWIFYHRPDQIRPRMSNYTILSEPQARRRWGTHSLKEWVVVVKTRDLWLLHNVRIHLDDVKDLGWFLEFEAMVSRQHDVKACHDAVAELRKTFAPILGESIAMSYADLLDVART
jgi:adenylate cyclase class 2